jgi:hypothetical protein
MAKAKQVTATATAATGNKGNSGAGQFQRTRKNSFERKCMTKTFKRLFAGSTRTVCLMALAADRAGRLNDVVGAKAETLTNAILASAPKKQSVLDAA